MSKQIVCPECSFENTPGSKYCNNCGTRLPMSTHIICPNCQASNPRNRIYCDNCGTRLIEEQNSQDESQNTEDDSSEPKNSNLSFFSLPTRKPGDTGGLSPDEKGQLTDSSDESLPKVEELTGKDSTADLPDWLVESNADPIINSPDVITTEHYFDLIKRQVEKETGQEASIEDIESAAADLPDWLSDLSSPPDNPKSEPSPSDQVEIPDWINRPDEKSAEGDDRTADSGDDQQDWLSELGPATTDVLASPLSKEGDEADELKDDGIADWLTELGPPNTNILTPSEEGLEDEDPLAKPVSDWLSELASDASGIIGEELPDSVIDEASEWLDGLPAPDTGSLSEPSLPSDETLYHPAEDQFEQDWIPDLPVSDTGPLAEPIIDPEATIVTSPDELSQSDWLDETLVTTGSKDSAPAGSGELNLSDWLNTPAFAEEELSEEESVIDESTSPAELEGWLGDLDIEKSDTIVAETPPSHSNDSLLDRLTPILPEDEMEASPDATSDLAQWMTDLEEDEPESLGLVEEDQSEEDSEPEQTGKSAENLPDWFGELGPSREEEDFSTLQQLAGGDDTLPDWLGSQGDKEAGQSSSEAEKFLTGLLQGDDLAGDSGLDWLTENAGTTKDKRSEKQPPISEATSAEPEPSPTESEESIEEDPAWLTSLFSGAIEEEGAVEVSEPDTAVPAPEPESLEPEDTPLSPISDELAAEPADTGDDTAQEPEDIFALSESDETWIDGELEFSDEPLPDWVEQLGPPAVDSSPESQPSTGEIVPSDEIPDWVASMRPDVSSEAGSLLPRATEDDDTLVDIPEELLEAELPEWLQDVAVPVEDTTPSPEADQISNGWIESESGLAELLAFENEADTEDDSSEWSEILGTLPAHEPVEERVSESELPEWVQALKPKELTGEEIEGEPAPLESGPLAGLSGVIDIAPVVTVPQSTTPIRPLTITKEQQQQAALLKQLTLNQVKKVQRVGTEVHKTSLWLRIVLGVLLIGSILLGLFGPDFLDSRRLDPPAGVEQAHIRIDAAANQTVLVAVEYTPALAGELSPQTEMFLETLAANNSQIVTISQIASGTAIAAAQSARFNRVDMGLLPGEAIGLRQIGTCLQNGCNQIMGRTLDDSQKQVLANVSLIILLTGDQDSLINWVEQVGSISGVPIVAGLPQSLGPVAAPYFASGQLEGYLVGSKDTAVFQQTYSGQVSKSLAANLNAQAMAQILAAVVLLIGALFYTISSPGKKKGKA